LGGLGDVTQPLEPSGPVVVQELAELLHLVALGPVQPARAVSAFGHEPGLLEDAEVLRDRRPRDLAEVIGDLGRRTLARPDEPEDLAPSGFCECLERRIHVSISALTYVSVN
jgi:hypothetical protein